MLNYVRTTTTNGFAHEWLISPSLSSLRLSEGTEQRLPTAFSTPFPVGLCNWADQRQLQLDRSSSTLLHSTESS